MGFSTMIVGFFFIFFDFNFGNINILPDLIGYIFIYFAAVKVISKMGNKYFAIFKKTSLLLIYLNALDMVIKHSSVLNGVINNPVELQGRVFLVLFTITYLSIMVYMFFYLAKGIELAAEGLDNKSLAEKARRVFRLVFIYSLSIAAVNLTSIIFFKHSSPTISIEGLSALLLIIAVMAALIYVFVQVCSLLNRAENTFS
ncbi:hypothetical protein [Neobacillus vireti]|uniref:DUF2975 domain-containing protein n=1 Tax=Neobacillus vireti LMG 21834 TaxID=1131730 RepID=A0AB94IHR1_9BACI|nr:hypothetical protein [Neobacillus vireti]ETI66555.1 hypothetical protein BAVI_22043 [Neobacillus vireti LMG 21834]KLT15250.1 hypothetical protein AA980_24040 [Neobacillus vireti]